MFLEIRDIRKSFGSGDSRVDVLKGLDLDIEKGEFCVLLGPSGSGKSTLLNIIGGIESVDAGSISIEGENHGGVQRPAENAGRTARPCHLHSGHHRDPEGAGHHPVPLPAV